MFQTPSPLPLAQNQSNKGFRSYSAAFFSFLTTICSDSKVEIRTYCGSLNSNERIVIISCIFRCRLSGTYPLHCASHSGNETSALASLLRHRATEVNTAIEHLSAARPKKSCAGTETVCESN